MPRSNPPTVIQNWLRRRWYRLWIVITAGILVSFAATSLALVALRETAWTITTGAVSGLLCAFLFGFIQAAVSLVGVMRFSTPLRGTMGVLIPTLAVAVLGHLSISLDLQVIPMVLTYGISVRFDMTLAAVALAVAVHVLVRVIDQFSDFSFGTFDRVGAHISIRSLFILTLVTGLEFALLRFANAGMLFVPLIFFLSTTAVTMLILRVYFVGFSWQAGLLAIGMVLLAVFGWQFYRSFLRPETVLAWFVFVATVIAIARWLDRQGWRQVSVGKARSSQSRSAV